MHAFFVRRPRFAFAFSVLIIMTGIISLQYIPTALLPDIHKPSVSVSTSYPSASPEVLETSFVRPVEEALNGIKNMDSIHSFSTNDGFATVKVTFKADTSLEQNEINVQNRLATISSTLPPAIQKRGLWIKPSTTSNQLFVISLFSPDNSLNSLQLSDYANRFLVKALSRVPGVADVKTSDSMEVSVKLNLNKMRIFNITTAQVEDAVAEQNQPVASGSVGQAPSADKQPFTFSIRTHGLLNSLDQIGNIIVKSNPNGSFVRLQDIATLDMRSTTNNIGYAMLNGKSTAFINVFQRSDANSLITARAVKKTLQQLSSHFPGNVSAKIIIDASRFIEVSVQEVISTLFEAILLVVLIIFLFLQNWRATLVPVVAIPVSLIGTLAFIALLGFSINLISLFALILSIGIVVDDAIIVVENVERHIVQNHLSPKTATIRAMKEITGPVIVTTGVLLSVFLAVAFLPGVQGKIFKQFAAVLSVSVLISAITALTLSPALCATLLVKKLSPPAFMYPVYKFINGLGNKYTASVMRLLKYNRLIMVLLFILLAGSFVLFKILPGGFIPEEDQGYLEIYIKLPQAISANTTNKLSQQVSDIVKEQTGVSNVVIIPDKSTDENGIFGFIQLNAWSKRKTSSLSAEAIMATLQEKLKFIPDAKVFVFNPPMIRGNSMGKIRMELQSTGDKSLHDLAEVAGDLADEMEEHPEFSRAFSNFDTDSPGFKLVIDRNKAKALGVSLTTISDSLSTLSPLLVSRLHTNNQRYDINLQAAQIFRQTPDNLRDFYVLNDKGKMISLSAFAELKFSHTASWIPHYNLYRSAAIIASPAPGYSTSDAIVTLQKLADKLPADYKYTWSDKTFEEMKSIKILPWLFFLAIVFIYLFLVALYESWSVPISVLIIIPVATSGAFLGLLLCHRENNIYVQIGLLLLIGMAAKSTILMIEFAIKARQAGHSIYDAACAAAKLRFRPVIMTSCSLIFGVIPLLMAHGPGA
ncbi:MAG: efflux RND transporter permease subunit, partial [Endozoicomonadaceae bacterium]|nr:efflux RND transporter permease subunit [Endozoicomonadaceae bacterium]